MRLCLYASAGGLALSFAAQAWAGEAGTPGAALELPPVVAPLPSEEAPAGSPLKRDASGAITVVTPEPHQGAIRDVAELAAAAPGVQLHDTGGLLHSRLLSLRGAPSSGVKVLLDGVPLNGAGGMADLSLVPIALVDRVEVLRGGGARYGSGGLGGVLNVVTPSFASGFRAAADVTYGAFGTWTGALSALGDVGDGQGLLLVQGARTRGDFTYAYDDRPNLPDHPLEERVRDNNDAALGGALLKYRRPLGAWSLEALLALTAVERGLAGTVHNPTADARESDRRLIAAAHLLRTFDEGPELSIRPSVKLDASRFTGGSFGDLPQRLVEAGVQAEGSASVGGYHALSASAEVAYEGLSATSSPAWLRAGVMAMDELLLLDGALVLAPSLRVDQTGRFTGLSPKLGATALLPFGFTLRANLGQAHRAPSFLELYVVQGRFLPNPALRPERALTADASLSRANGVLSFTVGGFYSLYEDLITYEYYPPLLAKAYNFAAAQVQGLEAEVEAKPHPLLALRTSYTLLFSQNLLDDPRYYLQELPYRPRHTLNARLRGGPGWLQGQLELSYQSGQTINRTGSASLPPRAFLHVGVSSHFRVGTPAGGLEFTVSLELKNALDVRAQDLDGYPLPGRAAYLSLAVSLESGSPPRKNP